MILWFKKIFQYIIGLFIIPKIKELPQYTPLNLQEELHTHPYRYTSEYKSANPPKNIFINENLISENKTISDGMDGYSFRINTKQRRKPLFKIKGLVPMFYCPICKGIVMSTYDNIWKCRTCKKEEHIIWFSNRANRTLQFQLINWIGEENEI